MLDKMNLIRSIFNSPFALFKEKVCIFESGIDDTYVLTSFTKNLWRIAEPETIVLKHFRGLIFVTVRYELEQDNYLLVLILKKHEQTHWNKTDWTQLYQKIGASIAILKNQNNYAVKEIEESENFTSLALEKDVSIAETMDAPHDFLDNYQLENFFMNQLKSDNLAALNKLVNNLIQINQTTLSRDKLQEKKYRLVSLITLLTRASIKQGCAPNLAYRLSDQLIQKMDEIEEVHKISPFLNYLILEFSILLQTRATIYTSEIVNKAIEFVSRNLYQPINNEDIADYVSVHPAYLSSLFKKETNTSLRQFIINERINEAQYLLSNTEISLKDISEILHFSNQSHFGKLFKEKTYYTPKEFRILF